MAEEPELVDEFEELGKDPLGVLARERHHSIGGQADEEICAMWDEICNFTWLPVDTAPTDTGTPLILLCTRPSPHTCLGSFTGGRWTPSYGDLDLAPTHWLPLPKPPERQR